MERHQHDMPAMDDDQPPSLARSFDRTVLRTWPAIFKLTELGLCVMCFLCNELSWYPFVPYPARTFLTVCVCLAFIATLLMLLALGFRIGQHYDNVAWWRILTLALPATCALFVMMASAAQANIGGMVDAGLQAAAVFGFLAFSTYLADAVYQFCQMRQTGQLPSLPLPPVVVNNLSKLTGKGSQQGPSEARGNIAPKSDDMHVPNSWNVPPGTSDTWSLGSDDEVRGTYTMQ